MSNLQRDVSLESDYKLCYRLSTAPSYNINLENTEAEVSKRGVDCRQYASEIRQQVLVERLEAAAYRDAENTRKLEKRVRQLEWDQTNKSISDSFNCIRSGGVQVGNTCF